MDTTTAQPYIFLVTIYGGMVAAAVYDVFRGIRRGMHRGRWFAALLDTLFILLLGSVVAFVLYTANMGELRLYTFAGFALGFALYIGGLSPVAAYLVMRIRERRTKKSGEVESKKRN